MKEPIQHFQIGMSNIDNYGHKLYYCKKEIKMNISFTEKQKEYITSQLDSGDFKNASEVVRDALRLHEVYRHRIIEDLRAEIVKGWKGGTSKRTATQIAQSKLDELKS